MLSADNFTKKAENWRFSERVVPCPLPLWGLLMEVIYAKRGEGKYHHRVYMVVLLPGEGTEV